MELVTGTAFNALILSCMYILVSLGFALLFNMLGILNLTHGAVYMLGAYLTYLFTAVMGFSHVPSLIFMSVVMGCFGLFLERFCFRPFVEDFNRMIMICVSIVVALQTTVTIIVGDRIMAVPAFVEGVLRIGSVSLSYERMLISVTGVTLLAFTVILLGRTKLGYQMQAISQHRLGAALQGIDVNQVSALASLFGCVLAGLAGSFMGSYLRLSPYMGDLMLVKVLIIVMLAGLGNLGGVIVTGAILGTMSAILPLILPGARSEAVTVMAVVLLLLLRPQGFFGRRELGERVSPEVGATTHADEDLVSWQPSGPGPQGRVIGKALIPGAGVFLAFLPVLTKSPYVLHLLTLIFIYAIATMSLRTILISGQLSLAHGAFMGIGAYLSAIASKHLGLPVWGTIPIAALLTALIGAVIGYPFLRLRGLYYAMGTLFFGIGVVYIIQAGGAISGGYSGLPGIPSLFNGSKVSWYFFTFAIFLSVLLCLHRLERSYLGRILKAIGQSYLLASSLGINDVSYRVLAVTIGCFFAGLAGALYAHYTMVLSSTCFNLMATLWLVTYLLLGGAYSLSGPIVGTAILMLLPEFARPLKEYAPFISSGLLFVAAYFFPGGLSSVPFVLVRALRRLQGIAHGAIKD